MAAHYCLHELALEDCAGLPGRPKVDDYGNYFFVSLSAAKFEKEALEFEFESWSEKLSLERQTELIAESQFAKQGSVPYRAALREYFSEKIWPEKKSQILKGNNLAAEFSVFQDNEKI